MNVQSHSNKKKTYEEIYEEINGINDGYKITNIERRKENNRSRVYISVTCDKGHKYVVLLDNYKNGCKCPECKREKVSKQFSKYNYYEIKELLFKNDLELITKEEDNWKRLIECKCTLCGRTKKMTITNFLKGRKCGCVMNNLRHTQVQFEEAFYKNHNHEEYVVIGKYKNNMTKIDILHNKCGKVFSNTPDNLIRRGDGCPYCNDLPKGEESIKMFLEKNNIKYQQQKTFEGLLGLSDKRNLSYDFYIEDKNILIEYQGKQHYEPVEYFGGEEKFLIQLEHDKRKKDFAMSNNIDLLEISYLQYKEIEDILRRKLL